MTLYSLRSKIQELTLRSNNDLAIDIAVGFELACVIDELNKEITSVESRLAQLKKILIHMEQVPTTPLCEYDLVRARINELELVLGKKEGK